VAKPLPRFGLIVWAFHPWAALRKVSQIAASRLRSVPVSVLDWEGAPTPAHELVGVSNRPVILAAPVEMEADKVGENEASALDDERTQEDVEEEAPAPRKTGRSSVPDELYMAKLGELVEKAGGVVPSAREVARRLGVGQDRARRLVAQLKDEPDEVEPDAVNLPG
jgi:hypothetical protein